jgi:hypothetical protein
MNFDDPDHAAILARRRRFILLALTGAVASSSTACRSEPCLTIAPPDWDSDTDPVTTVCPAELEQPVSLLNGSQIRLPKGITPEVLHEPAQNFVRLTHYVESVSCVEDMAGGTIRFFAMAVAPDEPSKSMPVLRDEWLTNFGYGDPALSAEVIDEVGRSLEVVIDQPPPDGSSAEPGRALMYLKVNAGQIHVIVYEVHPDAWNALQASFRASAASLSFPFPLP